MYTYNSYKCISVRLKAIVRPVFSAALNEHYLMNTGTGCQYVVVNIQSEVKRHFINLSTVSMMKGFDI